MPSFVSKIGKDVAMQSCSLMKSSKEKNIHCILIFKDKCFYLYIKLKTILSCITLMISKRQKMYLYFQ